MYTFDIYAKQHALYIVFGTTENMKLKMALFTWFQSTW